MLQVASRPSVAIGFTTWRTVSASRPAATRVRTSDAGCRIDRATRGTAGAMAAARVGAGAGPATVPVTVSIVTMAPGPSRWRATTRAGSSSTLPASDETTTIPSRVVVIARGRRPLRSSSAPTRRPSPKTRAAGPSHASIRSGRRSAGPPSPAAAGTRVPSASSTGMPERTSSSTASSSARESDPSMLTSGPAAARRRAHVPRPRERRRPRIASRLDRIVLISPLCARNPNGCASAHEGNVLVLYRWWNMA